MNTNVSNMPLDVFSDYCSEKTDLEWFWYYLHIPLNEGTNKLFTDNYTGEPFRLTFNMPLGMDLINHGMGRNYTMYHFCQNYNATGCSLFNATVVDVLSPNNTIEYSSFFQGCGNNYLESNISGNG